MRVVPPIPIITPMVLSNPVAEPAPGEVAFNLATTYLKGSQAIIGAPTSTVTISNGSPAVVFWAGHGLSDGTPVYLTNSGGALPAGLTVGNRYYVVNSTDGTFQLSDMADGAPISTTSAGSGTHTATAEVHRTFESQAGISMAIISITQASPAVITVNNHGMPNGTPVSFLTSSALPAGLTVGTVYYTVNVTASTFNVSATVGGAAINTSSAGAGNHTAIFNPNVGRAPLRDDGTYWVDAGPSTAWAMFDLERNTRTFGASPLTVVIKPGQRFDSLGIVGLIADSVTYTISVPGQPDQTETINLSTRNTLTWSQYYFGKFGFTTSLVRTSLFQYSGATITITATRASGLVGIGGVVLGQSFYIGDTQYEAAPDRMSFSKVTSDDYGNTKLVKRRNVPITSQDVRFKKSATTAILKMLDDLNATPALWIGIDDTTSGYFDSLLILGIYTRATMNLDLENDAMLSLNLQEV
jgi:hypothetical protein